MNRSHWHQHQEYPVMYLTTHLPDGRRHVDHPEEDPEHCGWALVIRGRPELGHITGTAWTVHRYTATHDDARAVAADLERTCAVEHAVVLPTEAHEDGPWWTGIGFWSEDGHLNLVGLAPGALNVSEGEDLSVGPPWVHTLRAPDRATARDRTYLAMAEAEDARRADDEDYARHADEHRAGQNAHTPHQKSL